VCTPLRQAGDSDWVVIERLIDGQAVPAAPADVAHAAIALHQRGVSAPAIADRLGEHERQVQRWISRHRKGQPLSSAGRPRNADATARLRLAALTREPRVARVPVDRLRFHPHNVRSNLGDLRQLTASIKAHGVLCPLMAHSCGSYLQLLHGHRRLAAARLAGLRSVPVLVVDEHEDDEAIALMLAENLMRAGLSRHDRRAAIRTLLDEHGHTVAGVAARLGITADTVRRWAADDEPSNQPGTARRHRRVYGTAVLRVVEQWTERAGGGLTADEARQLLAELAALATP